MSIDDEVIDIVEELVENEHQPLLTDLFPIVELSRVVTILYDEQQVPEDLYEFVEFEEANNKTNVIKEDIYINKINRHLLIDD